MYADNDGVSIYYEVDGPDEGTLGGDGGADSDASPPTVVFVEGLGYGRWMWQWQAEPLAEEYRTIVVDNRGTGDSDVPEGPYTVAEMASDLEAVLADAGIESVHVVGASMGGMIAQQYALDYDRAESLALLCTSHGGEEAVPTPPETQERMFGVPEDADEREAIRYKMEPAMSPDFWAENDDLIEQIVDWRLAGDATPAGREAQAGGVAAFDVSDEVGDVDLPTLLLHGTDDRVLPVENSRLLHEKLPNSELETVDGGPHLFFVEQADRVTDRLRSFLADAA
ncbi:alpha/beta fold hydrolase [Salinirubrum litoreum]|uniref:Alpha/beta fold hydrolase n=1 Tax=Salinirubrum litoreum TaxID=1126234 RepID=A0ABD5RD81_9EURY|nr:alpha/beta hydrolase [Salinirubrum litoreum]